MDKPQVDRIEGVPPAIAIDQSNPVRTSRSTVGTMTEINDHLKLLYARAATLHHPNIPAVYEMGEQDGLPYIAMEYVEGETLEKIVKSGKPLDLTPTELQLLGYLLARRGRTVSKTELLTQVWGYGSYDPNLVEARISSLRRKLETGGPRILHTVHGHGYTVRL